LSSLVALALRAYLRVKPVLSLVTGVVMGVFGRGCSGHCGNKRARAIKNVSVTPSSRFFDKLTPHL
jgi:hypothetical protein